MRRQITTLAAIATIRAQRWTGARAGRRARDPTVINALPYMRPSVATSEFVRAMTGDGVLVAGVESRAKRGASGLADVLWASTWAQIPFFNNMVRVPGRKFLRQFNMLAQIPFRGRNATPGPRVLSATYASARIANAFCAQPSVDVCGLFDVLLVFGRTRALAARACSTMPTDSMGLTCGCEGTFGRVERAPERFGLGPRKVIETRSGECVASGNLEALEAAIKNVTRNIQAKWGGAARRRVEAAGPYWPPVWESELQFQASDEVFAAFEDAFLGVGVVLVAGERAANAARLDRAAAFAAWLGQTRDRTVDVWPYVLRPAVGPVDPRIGDDAVSYVECSEDDVDAACAPRRLPPDFRTRRYHRVPRDFRGPELPPAPAWGHARAIQRGEAFSALDDWIYAES